MGDKGENGTGIEWTHVPGYRGETWNPVRGCTKISPGCKNCYAETFAERWRGVPGHPYEQGFDLRLVPEKLDEPLRAAKPRAYFVNSMSDLFQEGVPFDFNAECFGVMAATRRHLHMVLTKRADRMAEFFTHTFELENTEDTVSRDAGERRGVIWDGRTPRMGWPKTARPIDYAHLYARSPDPATLTRRMPWVWPLPNVWLGVSVEDRKYGLPRIDVLRTIPAAVRFLSVEPLLEDLGDINLTGIHWVIVGGESGRKSRPFAVEWAQRIVAQCREQGVPVFVKQPGDAPTVTGGLVQVRHKSDRAVLAANGIDIREWPKAVQVAPA